MLVGAEFAFKMDPRGEISDIKLPEKMLAMLRGEGEPAGAQGQFSEAGLKNMIAQMGLILPEGPVEAGATWARKARSPPAPTARPGRSSRPTPIGGPRAAPEAIDLTIQFDPLKPDPNIPVTIKTQESRGRFAFDNAAGRIAPRRSPRRSSWPARSWARRSPRPGRRPPP